VPQCRTSRLPPPFTIYNNKFLGFWSQHIHDPRDEAHKPLSVAMAPSYIQVPSRDNDSAALSVPKSAGAGAHIATTTLRVDGMT
jgi:hypothetical protein